MEYKEIKKLAKEKYPIPKEVDLEHVSGPRKWDIIEHLRKEIVRLSGLQDAYTKGFLDGQNQIHSQTENQNPCIQTTNKEYKKKQ